MIEGRLRLATEQAKLTFSRRVACWWFYSTSCRCASIKCRDHFYVQRTLWWYGITSASQTFENLRRPHEASKPAEADATESGSSPTGCTETGDHRRAQEELQSCCMSRSWPDTSHRTQEELLHVKIRAPHSARRVTSRQDSGQTGFRSSEIFS